MRTPWIPLGWRSHYRLVCICKHTSQFRGPASASASMKTSCDTTNQLFSTQPRACIRPASTKELKKVSDTFVFVCLGLPLKIRAAAYTGPGQSLALHLSTQKSKSAAIRPVLDMQSNLQATIASFRDRCSLRGGIRNLTDDTLSSVHAYVYTVSTWNATHDMTCHRMPSSNQYFRHDTVTDANRIHVFTVRSSRCCHINMASSCGPAFKQPPMQRWYLTTTWCLRTFLVSLHRSQVVQSYPLHPVDGS